MKGFGGARLKNDLESCPEVLERGGWACRVLRGGGLKHALEW